MRCNNEEEVIHAIANFRDEHLTPEKCKRYISGVKKVKKIESIR